ncbi:M10 family metallopeptidase C-terminal domain-containing protein, partial [Vibrio sp. 10N.261.55.A7]|uniref:calcium-binding protein n=1 Tax=Vibrio sp. 10N.261.55.A7 TaxID=1880851 RepID=UPI0018E4D6DA
TNSSEDPDTTQREIEVIVTDGHGLESEVATSLINVIPVSGTPVTNELPTANSFSLSSEHSVAEVDFEPNATDVEDDAVPSKVTEVKLEDMPTSGKLYYEASAGVYLELTKGSEVTDTSKVFYVADRDAEVTRTIDSSDGAGVVSGVDSLTVDNITLSGGTIVADQFVNDGQIKFDGNPSQGGFYVDSSLDNGQGTGHETQIGEYISIASEQGNISSLTVNFDSLNAHLGNGKAEIIAYIYDNGQLVDTQAVNITGSDNHAGSSTIVSSTTTFDEVRLVAVSDDKNSNASFNIASVDLTANGSVDIEDSFTYWAIDSDNQQSPTLGTVSVSASTAIKSTPTLGGHIDSVTALVTGVDVQGKLIYGDLDWQASAATIYEKEIHSSISYDSVNGAVIEAGIGNDTVNMGSGSDTIFLGMSHSPIQDLTVTPNDHDSAIRSFAEENLSSLTWGLEDEALKVDGSSTPGLDVGHGGGGNDEIYGEEGQDIIFGGTGHDLLDGGDGNDAVRGGSGNDTIIGGQGNDFLTGDDGEDIFKWVDEPFSTHEDVIIDFTKGEDRLDFSELVGEESGSEMEALLAGIEVEVEGTGDEADIKLTVNHDGDTQVIVLQDAASQYSPSELSDTASLLNDLMSIKITTD